MSDNASVETQASDPLKTIADAMENAVQAARHGAVDARARVDSALPGVSRFMSRFVYTTCYTISYGVVFPSVLVARSVPRNNALVHGLIDGANAAFDMVGEMKKRKVEAQASPTPAAEPDPQHPHVG
jgi:hypothetical protein